MPPHVTVDTPSSLQLSPLLTIIQSFPASALHEPWVVLFPEDCVGLISAKWEMTCRCRGGGLC